MNPRLSLLSISLAATSAFAFDLTPGNILVTSGPNEGRHVYEYTPTGTLVQTFTVPVLPVHDITDENRDVVVDSRGHIVVFNGTFNGRFSSVNPSTGVWSTWDQPSFNILANGTYGKVAAWGDFVFATDQELFNGDPDGIVRIDVTNGSW